MTNTKHITVKDLIGYWGLFMKTVFFPEHLMEEIDPAKFLADWQVDNKLAAMRQPFRLSLDILVDNIVDNLHDPNEICRLIQAAPLEVVVFYFERLLQIGRELHNLFETGIETLEAPVSWKTTMRLLFFDRLVERYPFKGSFLKDNELQPNGL